MLVYQSPTHNFAVLLRILDSNPAYYANSSPRSRWGAMDSRLRRAVSSRARTPSGALPLGIEKDKPFNPDARQQPLLLKGAAMGELMARNLQVNPRFAEAYWEGTSWYMSCDLTLPQ